MTRHISQFISAGAVSGLLGVCATAASAGTAEYCIRCIEPSQSYVCRVETNSTTHNDKAFQLFCIIRTSRDNGHRSCSVDATSPAACGGQVKSYSFDLPELPSSVRNALSRRNATPPPSAPAENQATQNEGPPKTLLDMTRNAIGSSREKIRDSGGAAGATRNAVGKAARGVGKGVSATAGKVTSATKKTGETVGGAAKTAWECMKSLFKDCRTGQ